MRLTWLPGVVFSAGLTTIIENGWETRGRDFVEPLRGVVVHHTATPASAPGDYPSLRIVRDGRVDLPGPIAQLGLGRSGRVYVIAAGRANHAGVGSWPGLLGNRDTIGIEAEHPGLLSHPWPTAQLDAYHRLCAALVEHAGLPTSKVIAHKEWAPTRKIDPIGLHMGHFRDDVQAIRDGGNVFLPLKRGDADRRKSDVAAVAYLLNAAYGTSIPGDGSWPNAMSVALRDRLGEDGSFVTGKMYAELLIDVARAQNAPTGTVDNVARNELVRLRNHLRQS